MIQYLPWHFVVLICLASLIVGFAIGAVCVILTQLKGLGGKKGRSLRFKRNRTNDDDGVFDYRAEHPGESYTYTSEAAKAFRK